LEIPTIPNLKVWAMENMNAGLNLTAMGNAPGKNLI
jgi:hypothetical protein